MEGIGHNAASTRIKNMGLRDEFINPLEECSYDDIRHSPQISKYWIFEKKRGRPYTFNPYTHGKYKNTGIPVLSKLLSIRAWEIYWDPSIFS